MKTNNVGNMGTKAVLYLHGILENRDTAIEKSKRIGNKATQGKFCWERVKTDHPPSLSPPPPPSPRPPSLDALVARGQGPGKVQSINPKRTPHKSGHPTAVPAISLLQLCNLTYCKPTPIVSRRRHLFLGDLTSLNGQ